ncbi:extracellular calcium-sensing receptor-like [Clytia hemisphaerica]|uniref:extracellular calcium-sensing receptor-like n=1 Tax=Clytia hemisphaerica TaxID=252671 RepID=UPI0034D4BB05
MALLYLIILLPSVFGSGEVCTSGQYTASSKKANSTVFNLLAFASLQNSLNRTSRRIYGLIMAEAILYTTKKVNDEFLPPHLSIQTTVFDDCGESYTKMLATWVLKFTLDPHPNLGYNSTNLCSCHNRRKLPAGVVGPDNSAGAKFLSELTSFTGVPVISYLATSVVLENRDRYPNFFRTVASDRYFVQALVDMVVYFGWSYISIIASDNSYGLYGRTELLTLLPERKICIDLDLLFDFPLNEKQITKQLLHAKNKRNSNIFILFASSEIAGEVLKIAEEIEFFDVTWIFSDLTSSAEWLDELNPRVVQGSIGAVPNAGTFVEFKNFFWKESPHKGSHWMKKYYEENLETWKWYKKHKDMYLPTMLVSAFVRNAVYAHAHALLEYDSSEGSLEEYDHTNYTKHLSNVQFLMDSKRVGFTKIGNSVANNFLILSINISSKTFFKKIGKWSKGNRLRMFSTTIWSDSIPKSICSEVCEPGYYPVFDIGKQCCWICVNCQQGWMKSGRGNQPCAKCPDGFSIQNRTSCIEFQLFMLEGNVYYEILCITSFALGGFCMLLIISWIRNRNHALVKASNFQFSLLQLVVHLLIFFIIPILYYHQPTKAACAYRPIILITLIVALVSILGIKAEALVKVFKSKRRISQQEVLITKSISIGYVIGSVVTSVGIIMVLVAITEPYEQLRLVKNDYKFYKEKTCYTGIMHGSMTLLYLIQIIFCAVQAFRGRHLPHKFGESRCILSCAIFMLLKSCVIAILLFFSAISDTMRLFIVVLMFEVSNVYVLVVMFARRTWSLLCSSEKDNREALRLHVQQNVFKALEMKIE